VVVAHRADRRGGDRDGHRAGVAALKCDSGEFITDDCGKAERLNTFFGSVFTVDNNVLPVSIGATANNKDMNIIDDINFSVNDVYKVLRHLKPKFSAGPDGYCAFFLKNIAAPIAFPLSLLFSQSFCSGDIPAVWRKAIVTPALKRVMQVTQITIDLYHLRAFVVRLWRLLEKNNIGCSAGK